VDGADPHPDVSGRGVVGRLVRPHRLHLPRATGAARPEDCGRSGSGAGTVGGKTPATLARYLLRSAAQPGLLRTSAWSNGVQHADGHGPQPAASSAAPWRGLRLLTRLRLRSEQGAAARAAPRRGGKMVGCVSTCEKLQADELRCKGAQSTRTPAGPRASRAPSRPPAPTAYSYAYDYPTSTFVCRAGTRAVLVLSPARAEPAL
jgi:hypothetical protein